MKDGFITIREHTESRNMWTAIGFGAGALAMAVFDFWLAYVGVAW